jgi:hypothetical protein
MMINYCEVHQQRARVDAEKIEMRFFFACFREFLKCAMADDEQIYFLKDFPFLARFLVRRGVKNIEELKMRKLRRHGQNILKIADNKVVGNMLDWARGGNLKNFLLKNILLLCEKS